MNYKLYTRSGFTLVEILVAIALLAIMYGALCCFATAYKIKAKQAHLIPATNVPPRFKVEYVKDTSFYLVTDTWTRWQYMESAHGGWIKLEPNTNSAGAEAELGSK